LNRFEIDGVNRRALKVQPKVVLTCGQFIRCTRPNHTVSKRIAGDWFRIGGGVTAHDSDGFCEDCMVASSPDRPVFVILCAC